VAALSLLFRCFLAVNSAAFPTKIELHQRLTNFSDFGTPEGACYDPLRFAGKGG
jgi:hypothetical protein